MQQTTDQMAEIFNKFGQSIDYHPSIVSYKNEMIGNLIIKIIETDKIRPDVLIYFQVTHFKNL